ncbi:treslin isoform X2 [Gouania willdenowi]|uniref:Treslin N-terminal domain-containing protein n=1 Tax=Gouania willdenowi TaxID=441366 RepID=A0A8C5DK60_GOUWI|nr:treslin isoform X2 [Gouania willdenowi]
MSLHNLVFVIDVDHGEQLELRNQLVKRGILRILLHFGYKYGFDKVRWGYKFFQSKMARNTGLMSRVSDFKELQHKSVEDFEQEFEAKFSIKDQDCPPRLKHQHNRSALVQNALKETLLDFQWDRPDITSPTKLSLRPRRSGRAGKPSLTHEEDISNNTRNIVFIISQCPRSRTQLVDYLCLRGKDQHQPVDLTEYIITKGLQDLLVQRQVVLHWVDSCYPVQVSECEDCLGFNQLCEVLAQQGGKVIPAVALLQLCCNYQPVSGEAFTFKSCIGYLLSSETLYRLAFPVIDGVLQWQKGGMLQSCGVTMEPLSRRRNLLSGPGEVCLKGLLQAWDPSVLTQTFTESWVLQGCMHGDNKAAAFQELVMTLFARGLHMVAEVTDNGLVCSAVFSPLSHCTALLTIIQPEVPQLLCTNITADAAAEPSAELPDVVSSVLGVVYDIMKEDDNDTLKDVPVPEWAQQEISRTPLTTNTLETWFPQSDQSGVSTHLMESMRLLHAVPEQNEQEDTSVVQQELITGLSELYQTHQQSGNKRSNKRGAQRTPVKQRMRSMSRSMQMLNVARLNVKAQKNQGDAEQQGTDQRGAEKPVKRRSSDRNKSEAPQSTFSFSTEAELLSHLRSSYEKSVAERDSSLNNGVQQLLLAIKAFFSAESDWEVKTFSLVQQHILKTSKGIRQLYGISADADSKVRECQLQVFLRLELCRLFSTEQSTLLDVDQMAEEVAEMLRIISLTKDPVIVTRFLQDEILPLFLSNVPRVLADIYHSLGTQLPKALVAVLPADFFSDESVTQDTVSPSASSPSLSMQSLVSDDMNDLRDLRTRSATKKRSGVLTRHRSMTESSQNLRQIEIFKKSSRASKSKKSVVLEKPVVEPQIQKQETKEVTKVRRNLFNQEVSSPSRKAKLPRSQSVSAVEGLKRTRSNSEGTYKLLTKKVCNTPLNKQVSRRLLQRQRMGRSSALSEECIIEESPLKPEEDLRRSPRLQKFARRHSSTFYSSSQPRSRNLERAFSASQISLSDGKINAVNVKRVRSPMRLLFGAAESPSQLTDHSGVTRASRSRLSLESSVFESPNKTPIKSPSKRRRGALSPSTPQTSRPLQSPGTSKTPPSSTTHDSTFAERLEPGFPFRSGMALGGACFRSPANKRPAMETPNKESPLRSPLKGILKTPVKALVETSSSSRLQMLTSPVSKTPKKSVTWSPSPHLEFGVDKNRFGVKTSGLSSVSPYRSPGLSKIPGLSSPIKGANAKRDLFKSPERTCHVSLLRISTNETESILIPEVKHSPREIPCKTFDVIESCNLLEIWPLESSPSLDRHLSPNNNKCRTPSPKHQMATRSGRTPVKTDSEPSFTPPQSTSERPNGSAKKLTRTRSNQTDQSFRHKLRSHSSENVSLKPNSDPVENIELVEKSKASDNKDKLESDTCHSSETDCSSQNDPRFDSSCAHSATTDSDSIDIVDAAIVNTMFSGGLKMNISFSRKPSVSGEDCLPGSVSSKQCQSPQLTPGCSYGFRQTPDRQQREAAARLGYANYSPRFSTPRGLSRVGRQKNHPNPLTYQVEMEMQSSGLPKLKFKRTDSMNTDPASEGGAQSPLVVVKPLMESPLALCSKHREVGCVSPSMCAHVTPAKCTPGKGGSVQTYICQSYTPTQSTSMFTADLIPQTPSPQSAGKRTPENLNSWPRRKRAQVGVSGGKDRGQKVEFQLEDFLEEAELGVSRLQDIEDIDPPSGNKQELLVQTFNNIPQAQADLSPLEELYWIEKLTQQTEGTSTHKAEEEIPGVFENEEAKSTATPPSSKRRKPVTPGGILALTQSPMLFKSRAAKAGTPQFMDGAVSGRTSEVEEPFPFSQPIKQSNKGRMYSRKRLIP